MFIESAVLTDARFVEAEEFANELAEVDAVAGRVVERELVRVKGKCVPFQHDELERTHFPTVPLPLGVADFHGEICGAGTSVGELSAACKQPAHSSVRPWS